MNKMNKFRNFATDALKNPPTNKQTFLYDFHVANGGKMVEFAGWDMPIQYKDQGVLASHKWTRQNCSLFDVGHMLQTRWTGKDKTRFLETLVVADLEGLPVGSSTLSLLTNVNGGIIDDTVINKQSQDAFYMVSNAGCSEKDLAHIHENLQEFKGDVIVDVLDESSLIALQGPTSATVLSKLIGKNQNLSNFAFMSARGMDIGGIKCYVSRCGYTGEDGFEISVPNEKVSELSEMLMNDPLVKLAGLGARDSLRLEAGLCLYGHDLNDEITPVEAGLTWTIGKRRKIDGGFLGSDPILAQIKQGPLKRRIGFVVDGAPAREKAEIYSLENEPIGVVTSGCPSPSLGINVGMGYVTSGYHKAGTEVLIKVRNKMQKATISKMPFVPSKYYRIP